MFRFHKALIVTAISVLTIAFFSLFCYRGVYAERMGDDRFDVGTLAVFLSVGVGYRDGQAFAEATNKLTVLPGEVSVTLRLRRADKNPASLDGEMETVAEISVDDLDFTEKICVTYSADGDFFWMAEVVYSVDGGKERMLNTEVVFFDESGNVLEAGAEKP